MIRSEKPTECQLDKVSELIQNGQWNVELLKTVFDKKDCRRIRRIPVSITNCKDRLV